MAFSLTDPKMITIIILVLLVIIMSGVLIWSHTRGGCKAGESPTDCASRLAKNASSTPTPTPAPKPASG